MIRQEIKDQLRELFESEHLKVTIDDSDHSMLRIVALSEQVGKKAAANVPYNRIDNKFAAKQVANRMIWELQKANALPRQQKCQHKRTKDQPEPVSNKSYRAVPRMIVRNMVKCLDCGHVFESKK